MEFEIDVETTGLYTFDLLVAAPGTAGVLTAKTMDITSSLGGSSTFTVTSTGGWGAYEEQSIDVILQAGPQTLRFEWTGGGNGYLFNIDYFDVEFLSVVDNPPTIDPIADVEIEENAPINILISVNDDTNTSASIVIYDKSINTTPNNTNTDPYTSGGTITGYSFTESPSDSGNYTLVFASGIADSRSYFARVTADDGSNPPVNETFNIDVAHSVSNDVLTASVLDATTFSDPLPWYGNNPQAPFSVSIENSGTNIGYIENGEFVEYLIYVPTAGPYEITLKSANGSGANGSSTNIDILEEGNATPIGLVTVPKTTWGNYQDYTTTVSFTNSGLQTLRLVFDGGVNSQTISFKPSNTNSAPVVNISAPNDGIALTSGTSLDFIAAATDFQEGDLSSTISWTSDLDGALGTGASVSSALTTVGTHVITAEATDNDVIPLTGSNTITLLVTESDPTCDARFRVNAGGPALLANSGNFEEDQASAAADAGNTAQPGTPSPYLDLTAPAIDKTFGSTVALVANTTGYPDYLFQTERFSTQGNTNNMNWSFPTGDGIFEVKILFNENWGGELNNPRVFDVEIEGDVALDDYRPSVDGTQINIAKVETYLATVEDGILNVNFIQGTQNPSVKGFDICYVSDLPTDTPPSIVINSPTTNGAPTSVVRGTQINLAATATDQEDDDTTLTSNINWSIDPFEPSFGGSGGSFTDELFIPGTYTITATVTDDDGNEVSDDIELTIEGPDVDFVFPADGAIVNDTELMVTWTALNMFLEGPNNEHFHIWVNPTDTDNLVTADRISTASVPEQLFWNIGATDGIVEGQNTLVILAAESGHDDFTSVEAKDIVTFTVSIPDTTDPEIECPEDIVVSNDEGDCGAVVNYSVPVGTDDKPGVVTSLISGLASGESFPLGTTTVTYEVVDAAGNDAQCSFTVTVNDDEAPEIICPPDISVVSLDGSPINIADIGMATATDNCDTGLTVSSVVLGSTDPIPSFFPVGPTTIQWSTVDAAGNPAFCNQTITVTFTPSSDNDITEFTLPGQTGPTAISGTDIAITMPVGSDVTNLVPASLVFSAGASISPAVGDAQDFSVPVDYTVTAQDNSTKTYTVNVTVLEDTTDPEVVCPDDIIVSTDENECGAIVNYTIPVGTDDQPGVTTFLLYGLESGEFFPLGDTLIVYEVQDAAGNNANCSFKVTVNDDEAPEIICPPDISVVSLDGSPINIADIGMATATDNCDTGLTVSSVVLGSTDPIPAFFPVGPTTIQWSTVDAAGNPAFCNQTITVTFTPSSDNDITEFTLPGQTGPTAISGTDIAITMPLGSNVTNLVPASLVFSPGATISPVAGAPQDFSSPVDYVVTAQDNSTQTYTVNVTVEQDTTDPEVECPEDIVVSNDAGDCGAVVNFMASATDDQPGVTTSASIPSGSVFPVGTTTVTVTATDAAGNTAECTFDITVNDVEPPTAICSDTTITLNSSGIANIDPNVLASDSSDACGISSITASQTTFSQADIGLNTITLTITDLTGNTSTCNSIVNVEEAVIVGTTELTVLDATTDTPLFDLFDGMVIQKSDIGNTPLGVIFNTDYNPGGVYFILTGPLTESRNEGPTPHSLFGDIGVDIQGKVFPIGDYTLIANPVNGPTLTVNFSVVDGPDPCEDFDVTLDAADGTLTCGGTEGKISISVSGASLPLTYSWSHDNSLQSDSALNLSAGTYSVTVTDANGCSDSVTATLSDPAGPSVQLGATSDPSTCGGADGSIAISAIGAEPMTYVWSHDNALQSAVAAGLSAGSYVVTVTDANGCSETVSTTLSDPSAPNVTLGSFSSVPETDAPFNLSGGLPSGGSYSGQGVTNGIFDPSIGSGTYAITYSFTDPNSGCSSNASKNIIVNPETPDSPLLVLDATDDSFLFALTDGLVIQKSVIGNTPLGVIYDTSYNPGGVYFILTGPLTESRNEGPTPHSLFGDIGVDIQGKVFPIGDYTLIANPVNGPTLTVNFSVVDGPDPCEDFDVTLDAADGTLTCGGTEGKISISVSGASLPLTYSWSHDNSLQSDSALNLSAGTYSVTVTDANGCSDSVTATLSDPAGPSVQLGATSDPSTCGGADGSIAISAIGAEPMTYVWSHDNALQSAVAAGLSAGSYVVTVTDANGCSETVSTTLSDPSAPNVTLGSFSSVLESDAPFSLSGGSPSGGFYSGQGVTNGVFDPSVGPGSYVITYNYTDSSTGCEGSATATIQVNVDTPPTMELVSFTLVNADNDQDIVTLTDGINILIEDLPTTNLNIRANTAGNVGSVSMSLSGSQTKTMVESVAPYALYGDFPAGDYYAGNLGVGNYVISGTPYSLSGAAGTAGISLTIEFEISEESFFLRLASPKEMIISPNPVDRIATVVFETPKRVATIYLYDGSGRLAKVHYGDPGKEVSIEQVPVQDLPGGIYYVRTVDSSGRQFQQQMAINR